MQQRRVERERPAHRVADEEHPVEGQRVEQGDQVVDVGERRRIRGRRGVAVASPVVCDHVEPVIIEQVGHRVP